MSLPIAEKLANGESLSEEEVQYAVAHGLALPEEYQDQVEGAQAQSVAESFGSPAPLISAATYPSSGVAGIAGPSLTMGEDVLQSLTKDVLADIAEAVGVDASGTKAQMVSALVGGAPVAEGEDEETE